MNIFDRIKYVDRLKREHLANKMEQEKKRTYYEDQHNSLKQSAHFLALSHLATCIGSIVVKKNKDIVYCRTCKYSRLAKSWWNNGIIPDTLLCAHPNNITFESTALSRNKHLGVCEELNKSNDCPLYKKSLLARLRVIRDE